MPTSPPTTECADACEFADNICEIRCFLLPRLRSLPLYHSHPQTALPDLFVFFRRFVRQPKEILRFCGQHEKNRESFKKFSNNYRKNQTSLAQNLAFCQCCTKTYFAAESRRRQKKQTKQVHQSEENKINTVKTEQFPKSCPFLAEYGQKLSARCAEFGAELVRQIDFCLSTRLNKAITGEYL